MGAAFSAKFSSKKKGPDITDTDKAVLSLKAQRKKLADQQKLLELRIDRHVEVAKVLVREKQSTKALLVLKKKKLVEKQLDQLGALQVNTEAMINDVEMSKQQNKLFAVLQQGNDALKALQKEVTVEDVRKLMDDTAEAKAYQDEMAEALSQSLSSDDTEAVAEEMEALEAEALAAEVAALPVAPKVPEGQQVKVRPAAEQRPEAVEEAEPERRQALLAS